MAKFCSDVKLTKEGVHELLGSSENHAFINSTALELCREIAMQERAGLKTEDDMKNFSSNVRRAAYISNVEPSVDKHKGSGIAIGHVWANYGSTTLNNKFKTISKAMSAMAGTLIDTEKTGDA